MSAPQNPSQAPTFRDALGQSFAPTGLGARIASLVPSLTETLFDIGLGPQIVARTGFCVHPADAVHGVAKVGGTKDVNLARLQKLAPSHVLVNVDENTRDTVQALRAFVPHVMVTHPQSPHDNLALFDMLGGVFGATPGVRERARAQGDALRAVLQSLQTQTWAPRRLLYLIWREPWMTVARDTYLSRTLASVGWHTLPDIAGGDGLRTPGAPRYPVFSWDAPWIRDVDLVLLSTEPYRFDPSHAGEVRRLLGARGSHVDVRLIDGTWCTWYGSRAVRSLPRLAALARALG